MWNVKKIKCVLEILQKSMIQASKKQSFRLFEILWEQYINGRFVKKFELFILIFSNEN